MSDSDEPLDLQLASKLRRAADTQAGHHDPAPLEQAAQARVLAAMLRESQILARLQRRRRVVQGALLAVAASLALALSLRAPAPRTTATLPAARCALPVSLATTRFSSREGRQLLALGRFGTIAAESDAELTVIAASECELIVSLTRGTLAADLHDLRPAKLSIRTTLGDVQVRGTTFSVRVDSSLEVALLKGAVDVVTHGDHTASETTQLTPGHVLHRQTPRSKPDITLVSSREEQTIAALIAPSTRATASALPTEPPLPVELEVAPPKPDEPRATRSATELLALAESARRAGRLDDARSWYGQAGAQHGADAEVALLRWARLQLSEQEPGAALDVLQLYQKRFSRGRLAAEASSLKLRALELLGRHDEARATARALIERFPDSPHAKAARRVLQP